MNKVNFFPIGNADTCLVTTEGGQKLLFDFASPKNQGGDDKRIDLAQELRDDLDNSGRDYFDVVSFSHLDTDHFAGASDFFYLEHAKKYQSEDRVKINEMWVPASVILEKRWQQSEEGRVVQAEARHRLREGKGIRVISEPKALDDWLEDQGIDPGKRRDHIVTAGNCVPGLNLDETGVEVFVHSPFSYQRDQNETVDRNGESSVFHLTIKDGVKDVKLMLTADAPYDVLEDIVSATERAGNSDRLEWDLMKIPHHCSYKSVGPDKGDEETVPAENVKRLYYSYGRKGAILVSPSNVIPDSDEIQPPHKQAAKFYEGVSKEKDGQFLVTMEYPDQDDPKPVNIEVSGQGVGATVRRPSSNVVPPPIMSRSPRAG